MSEGIRTLALGLVFAAFIDSCAAQPTSQSLPPATVGDVAPSAMPASAPKPEGMVLVPAGHFWMGCDSATDDFCEKQSEPRHEVYLDAYYIDITEVTVQAYAACVQAGGCDTTNLSATSPDGQLMLPSDTCNWGHADRGMHPINCVGVEQADGYCRWASKRLPTEAEWEKAARGGDERLYPWGNERPTCELAVISGSEPACAHGATQPVGSRKAGASPYGVLDMAGNVWEFVADGWSEDAYSTLPKKNPRAPRVGKYVIDRGKGWSNDSLNYARAAQRHALLVGQRADDLGFRCVRSL